jgi:hypothetical protein
MDSFFQRALSNMLTEIFNGPPGQEAYVINPGDPGLLRQLDAIDAKTASASPAPGQKSIAAHVDHVQFGLAGRAESVGRCRLQRELAAHDCQR